MPRKAHVVTCLSCGSILVPTPSGYGLCERAALGRCQEGKLLPLGPNERVANTLALWHQTLPEATLAEDREARYKLVGHAGLWRVEGKALARTAKKHRDPDVVQAMLLAKNKVYNFRKVG